jgi:hypothetical protein
MAKRAVRGRHCYGCRLVNDPESRSGRSNPAKSNARGWAGHAIGDTNGTLKRFVICQTIDATAVFAILAAYPIALQGAHHRRGRPARIPDVRSLTAGGERFAGESEIARLPRYSTQWHEARYAVAKA